MKRNIAQALNEHLNAVIAAGYQKSQILGIFLYGSQNYGTDLESSDVDTKCILVPSLEDLCLARPVSKEIHLENGEHCEIKDIREIVVNFRKQNINFLEILYTKYRWVNPFYEDVWNTYFVEKREQISHYDMNRGLQSICGQALHTIKQNKTNGKKISNGLRLCYFLQNYLLGKEYNECIYLPSNKRQELRKLKKTVELADEKRANQLIKNFETFRSLEVGYIGIDKEKVDKDMNDGVIALVKKNIYFFKED